MFHNFQLYSALSLYCNHSLLRCSSQLSIHYGAFRSSSRKIYTLPQKEKLHRNEQTDLYQKPVPLHYQRCLTVAVVGYPNAGKSQLTNALVGTHVTGVSSKRNTTIQQHLGAFIVKNSQVVLVDTPGLTSNTEACREGRLESLQDAWSAVDEADVVLMVVDCEKQYRDTKLSVFYLARALVNPHLRKKRSNEPFDPSDADQPELGSEAAHLSIPPGETDPLDPMDPLTSASELTSETTRGEPGSPHTPGSPIPTILVLNKVDKLLPLTRQVVLRSLKDKFMSFGQWDKIYETNAMHSGGGVHALKQYLLSKAPLRPWKIPEEQPTTEHPARLAVEFVREQLFRRLNQEVPYSLEVTIKDYTYAATDQAHYIDLVIWAPSRGVKAMLDGVRTSVLEEYVTRRAAHHLTRTLGKRVVIKVSVRTGVVSPEYNKIVF